MPNLERVRECVSGLPDSEYFAAKAEAGWSLVAIEWERQADGEPSGAGLHEVPFGFRIAPDCLHLEDSPDENIIVRIKFHAGHISRVGHRVFHGER